MVIPPMVACVIFISELQISLFKSDQDDSFDCLDGWRLFCSWNPLKFWFLS
jgi:hypothetical protein